MVPCRRPCGCLTGRTHHDCLYIFTQLSAVKSLWEITLLRAQDSGMWCGLNCGEDEKVKRRPGHRSPRAVEAADAWRHQKASLRLLFRSVCPPAPLFFWLAAPSGWAKFQAPYSPENVISPSLCVMTLRQLQYASERSLALSLLPSRSLRISAPLCFSLPLSLTPRPLFVDRVLLLFFFLTNSMAKSLLDSLPVEGQLRFNLIEITHTLKEGRRHTGERAWRKAERNAK